MAIYAIFCYGILLAGCAQLPVLQTTQIDAANAPPPAPREFRAAWVATVANIDWPSKKGLSVAEQQREIIRIVDRAKELNLNALIFQVRPAADAMYPSILEPWSEYLMGEQGKFPNPFYDPLKMWIDESHKRGIELHAWFNPYRARHTSAKSPNSPMHIANTNPKLVKNYGGYQWMDPGEDEAAERTLNVILDVVRRYDIDGVHVDDYFYPYPVPVNPNLPVTENSPEIDFPDEPSWSRYLLNGGKLARAEWRRNNVNRLIERINSSIHREKPWMRFGVSPFGLGRPDRRPPGIIGFSQYDKLYADVELWLAKGWVDYLAPQLYWPIEQSQQAFGPLMQYWVSQNAAGRDIWPGLFTSRIDGSPKSWKPDEIVNQVALTRRNKFVNGQIHFSMIALMENRQGIADRLKASYATPAVVPAMPWLSSTRPSVPQVQLLPARQNSNNLTLSMRPNAAYRQFAIWQRRNGVWTFSTSPVGTSDSGIPRGAELIYVGNKPDLPDAFVVSAIDRFGNESERVMVNMDEITRPK
ncbi:MAG: family 10 glycosylhydrolase [Usitatibacteraceae bacterium]